MDNEDKDKSVLQPLGEVREEGLEQSEEDYEEPGRFDRILDYIGTKKGDMMLGRVVSMLEQITPAAKTYIDALADVRKVSPDIDYKKWRLLMIMRFLVVVVSLITIVYMSYSNTLNSTTSLLVAGIAAGFLSYGRKQP